MMLDLRIRLLSLSSAEGLAEILNQKRFLCQEEYPSLTWPGGRNCANLPMISVVPPPLLGTWESRQRYSMRYSRAQP